MTEFLKIICSIPKTVYFNFRYLPLSQAIHLPIWIASNCKNIVNGRVKCNTRKFAAVRIGFHEIPIIEPQTKTVLRVAKGGLLTFEGTAHIGRGSKIHVADNAQLILGDNFAISASTSINCYKKIVFGRDIQFSWECLVMDSDTHNIYDESGKRINEDQEIIFGNKVWIGCRCTILKGSVIPNGTVIGACSLVSGKKFAESSIIVGSPAKSVKNIGRWEL